MALALVLAVLIGAFAVWLFNTRPSTRGNLKSLPGPFCLPLVGYMPFLTSKPYMTFIKLAHRYGPIFKIEIGHRTVMVLNSREAIREAFNRDASFTGRPDLPNLKVLGEMGRGRFAFRTGDYRWKYLRKTALKALSLFASSRNSKLDAVVREGSESLARDILETSGKPFDPKMSIFDTVAAIIGSLNFGLQFNRKDEMLRKLVQLTKVVADSVQVGSLADYLPFGKWIFRSQLAEFKKALDPLDNLTDRLIFKHVCNDTVQDIADALNQASLEVADESEAKAIGVNSEEVKNISTDLFAAGFATTMETSRWAIALLTNHPEVQKRLQSELDSVLQGRVATLLDKDELNFTEAILLEVLRCSSLIPLGLPHFTMTETELLGYHIPQNIIVFANLYAINHDPQLFENPEEFRPERFLCANGSLNTDLAQQIMPFSVGKRRCAGENLARQEIFLLLAHLFQKFSFSSDPNEPIDTVTPTTGFGRFLKPYKVVAVPRKT